MCLVLFRTCILLLTLETKEATCLSQVNELATCRPNSLYLECVQLHSNECTKRLGVHLDRYLTLNHHVLELCRKAARQVNCLMRLSTMLPVESKITIFIAFIVSNFLYCPVVWRMCSKSDTKKVEKVQERALCFIYRKFESDYKSLLNLVNVPLSIWTG